MLIGWLQRRSQVDPLAGLAPTGLDLGDAEQAVAVFAEELGAVPLQQIVGGAADAGGRGKQMQALLAALLLIGEGPAQAEQRVDDEEEDLQDVRGIGEERVDWPAGIRAQ